MSFAQQRLFDAYLILREEGITEFLKKSTRYIYVNKLRKHLPAGEYPKMNDIIIASEKHRYVLFDDLLPWDLPSDPNWSVSFDEYKNESVRLIDKYTSEGERAVIIGGGFGVSTISLAENVGSGGQVISYEASDERYTTLKRTVEINSVSNVVVKQKIVGDPVDITGGSEGATGIDPSELNNYDILEMDCEGAELSILNSIRHKPRLVIVETHPDNNSPTREVVKTLQEMGYKIVDKKPDPGDGHVIAAESE